MKINGGVLISFGYKTVLSKLYDQGLLPNVKKSLYGDDLERSKNKPQSSTNEHMQPHSQGGKTSLENIALETYRMNNLRGDKPFSDFYTKENGDVYFKQFEGLIIEYVERGKKKIFYGDEYIKKAKANIDKILEAEKKLNILA